MSHHLPASTDVASLALGFIQNLFRRPAPVAARGAAAADSGDVWALYRMSRGADSVSPAVLRQLAKAAAQ